MEPVTTHNPLKILWLAFKGLWPKTKIKFSWINFVNILNIALTVLIPAWTTYGVISMGASILITSAISVILKFIQSHETIVNTGVALDPQFYLITMIGILFGGIETVFTSGYLQETMSAFWSNTIVIVYSLLLIILRTGYTNQPEATKG